MFLPLLVCRRRLASSLRSCALMFNSLIPTVQQEGSDNYLLNLALCASINTPLTEHVSFPKITLPNNHTKHAHANNV